LAGVYFLGDFYFVGFGDYFALGVFFGDFDLDLLFPFLAETFYFLAVAFLIGGLLFAAGDVG
jgi:hypothetical protein